MIHAIETALRNRELVWVGPRGIDAQPMLALPNLARVFSVTDPLRAISLAEEYCLELETRIRPDLDTYSLDTDRSPAAEELRARLAKCLTRSVAIVPYRPLELLSSALFPRLDHVLLLGPLREMHRPFEHKPWVETSLRARGIPIVPWTYVATHDLRRAAIELRSHGTLVLRTATSSGGAGVHAVSSEAELRSTLAGVHDEYVATAPLLSPCLPLNLNACVFPNGTVTPHGVSVQVIGHPKLTSRAFGYCGNDFGAARSLSRQTLEELDRIARIVGTWLSTAGYRGAFGLDLLLHEERLLLCELNPRFQGSSPVSAWIDRQLDRPDLHLCHMAASLDLPPPPTCPLAELVSGSPPCAHLVMHSPHTDLAPWKDLLESRQALLLLPDEGIVVQEQGVTARITIAGSCRRPNPALSQATSVNRDKHPA